MRLLFFALTCVLLTILPSRAEAERPNSMVRIHVQTAGENLPSTQAMPVTLDNPPETIYVKNPPELSEHDIVGIDTKPTGTGNAVKLIFSAHGKDKLRNTTVEHRGRILVVVLNGRVIYAPRIDTVISNGVLVIPSGVYDDEVKYLKEDVDKLLKQKRAR